jgi:glycosyltransferase involved in cell wall biosynthesis
MVSPWPPTPSGISDYSQELLSYLGQIARVTAYPPAKAGSALEAGHDVLLFQIGNDPLHAPSIEALRRRPKNLPAVLVLHDFVLHHLFAAAYLDRGREKDYAAELARAHGEDGRVFGDGVLEGVRPPVWDTDPWRFPLSAGVISDASAVIVHSTLVRGAVLRARPRTRVVEIPHHVVPAARAPRAEARRQLGLPLDRPVGVTLGVVTPAKRVGKILEALAAIDPAERPFLFVGGAIGSDDPLLALRKSLGLADDVAFGGFLSEEDFFRAAAAADFAINLRYPTMGETSGAVSRLAGFGLPMIVSDVGWFRELPGSFCEKAPIGGNEIDLLTTFMKDLSRGGPEHYERSVKAFEWAEARHPSRTAKLYLKALEEAVEGWAVPRTIPTTLAEVLSGFGVGAGGRSGSRQPDSELVAGISLAAVELWPEELFAGARPPREPGSRPAKS